MKIQIYPIVLSLFFPHFKKLENNKAKRKPKNYFPQKSLADQISISSDPCLFAPSFSEVSEKLFRVTRFGLIFKPNLVTKCLNLVTLKLYRITAQSSEKFQNRAARISRPISFYILWENTRNPHKIEVTIHGIILNLL